MKLDHSAAYIPLETELQEIGGSAALENTVPEPQIHQKLQALSRFCKAAQLELTEAVTLGLKLLWEKSYKKGERPLRREPLSRFRPDTAELESALKAAGYECGAAWPWQGQGFRVLANEIVLRGLHLGHVRSAELAHFVREKAREAETLRSRDYLELKDLWIFHWGEYEERAYELECTRLRCETVKRDFVSRFPSYVALQEEIVACTRSELLLLERMQNDGRKFWEIEEAVDLMLKPDRERLFGLHDKVGIPVRPGHHPTAGTETVLVAQERTAAAKKVWGEIIRLIHPDRLQNDPRAKQLTDRQRELLRGIFAQITAIARRELRFEEDTYGSEFRSLDSLVAIRARVIATLEGAGLRIEPGLIVQGNTDSERAEFLQSECRWLIGETERCRVEIRELEMDSEILLMQRMLNNPDHQEQFRRNLEREVAEKKREREAFEGEIDALRAAG